MPNEVAIRRQEQNIKFNAVYILLLAVLGAIVTMFATSAVVALTSGQWFNFILSTTLLIYSLWAVGASFISIPLVMYLNKKYAEKKYGELDVAHSRALKIVMQLPCRKSADVPVLMSNLALMRLCQGNYDSAEELFRKATEYIAKDNRLNTTFAAAILTNNLGCACMRRGHLAEAEVHANKALELFELKKNKAWRIGMALPHLLLGVIHAKFGEFDVAEEHIRKCRHILDTEKLPPGTVSTSFQQGRNQAFLWLSFACLRQEKREDADESCDAAIASIAADPAGANTLTIEILLQLANEYMNLKDFSRAEKLLEIAYAIAAESPFHPDAKPTLSYFEKLLLLTDRENEVADMRNWLRHVDHHLMLLDSKP